MGVQVSAPAYALAQVSVNGAAPVRPAVGPVVVYTDTIQLSGVSSVGWTSQRWEITDYPPGWACPAGWHTDEEGVYYSIDVTPPLFTMPDVAVMWGKWMVRLRVNEGVVNNSADQRYIDEGLMLEIVSPKGLHDLGAFESKQCDPRAGWAGHHKLNLRTIEEGMGGGTFSGNATSLQNVPVSASAPASGSVLFSANGTAWSPVVLTADMILPGFTISLFAPTVSALELGQPAATPAFTAAYTTTPDSSANSVVLTDDQGTSARDVSSSATSFTSLATITKTTQVNATFTLTAKKGAVTRTSTTAISWLPRVFWGVGGSTINAAGIAALANSALSGTRARNYQLTASAGQYCWYCFPASWGVPYVTIGGFAGGVNAPVTVAVTNAYGVLVSYYAIRTVNDNLGQGTTPQTFVWS